MDDTKQGIFLDPLSERELEILGLIEEGCTNREIAQRLVLSLGTIKWYTKQIYSKLGVHSRTQAVACARAAGLMGAQSEILEGSAFAPQHNLPAQLTPFVGREVELAELTRLLADPDVRLVTILGAGGMGKTRLALETGSVQLGNFQHGVYFISLAALQLAEVIVPTIAGILGFSFYEGREPRQQLLDYLRQKNILLIMDNFEHLLACHEPGRVDSGYLVSDILETAPRVKVLSTSRTRLNLQGEHLFYLEGMDFPDLLTPEEPVLRLPKDVLEYSAIKLFLQSAYRVKPGLELAADDLKHVARICSLVGGMPLGILLSAAWLTMLTPAEIADQVSGGVEASLDFLETDLRDLPKRQRSIRAVFDHSWNLLTTQEQAVMQALSVFRGGFTWEAAQQVTGATLRELRALVDRSLLQRDSAGRYGIHELLRQYAADKLHRTEEPEEEGSVRDAHATYYAAFLASRDAPLRGIDQKQVLAEIRTEVDNIRVAWNWAVTRGKIDEVEQSLSTLARFYRIRGWYREGETLFSEAAQGLSPTHEDRTRLLRGKLLLQQGRFTRLLGNESEASHLQEASLVIFRELDAKRDMAYALCLLGGCESLYGLMRGELCLEGLSLFREIDDQQGTALALYGLAWSALHRGEYTEAKQNFQQSLTLFRQVSDLDGIRVSLHGLGYVCWILGEYERGKELHLEMLQLCREAGDQGAIARALGDLGIDTIGLGSYRESCDYWQQSLALYREIGNLLGIMDELGDLAELANTLGDHEQAIRLAQESLGIQQQLGDDPSHEQAWDLRILGIATCGLGDFESARRYFSMSLEASIRRHWPASHLLTLVGVAGLLAKQGDQERALELLVLVMSHRFSWQWAKDQATPLIAELEAELPPDLVAAAWERGQVRDLDTTVVELRDELAEGGTVHVTENDHIL